MSRKILALVLMLGFAATCARGEDDETPTAPEGRVVPLRVHVVFTRLLAEKKVSSYPYTVNVAAAEARHGQRSSSLRMGIQVPLSVRADVNQPATVMFKDVGTNLDCMATVLDAGRFRLDLSLEQGSLAAGGWEAISSTPVLRTFRSSSSLFLSDGQTSRYVAATDPVSGEVLQVDVTLNVVK